MSFSFYIYYKVDLARSSEAQQRSREFIAAVQNATQISGKLMKKRGEPALWMEVYEDIADAAGFETTLKQIAQNINVDEFLQSPAKRHIECFES